MIEAQLLHENVARELSAARRAGWAPTAAQLAEFTSMRERAAVDGQPRNLRIAGNEAEISVCGVLTKSPDSWYYYSSRGNTSYHDIRSALALAEADPNIRRVVLKVDSPGGMCDGLLDTILAIEAFSKPIVARAHNALSAAYALAAACNRIEAVSEAAELGCLGVAATYFVWEDEITLTNTESPEKRPDPKTPEGKASIVRHLDAINAWFVGAIARGRTRAGKEVTVEQVNTEFGRGACLMAPDAKKRGMCDSIMKPRPAASDREPRAEGTPEPGGPDNAPTGEETGSMNKVLLAQALGIAAAASDEAFEAAVAAMASEYKSSKGALASAETAQKAAETALQAVNTTLAQIEEAVGAKGPALLGAITAMKENTKLLGEANAKIAEQAKAAENAERESLIDQATSTEATTEARPHAGKLTPAMATYYRTRPIEELKGFLPVASRVIPAAVNPRGGAPAGAGNGAAPAASDAPKWNGKTYAELSFAERAKLAKEDEGLFNEMREHALENNLI